MDAYMIDEEVVEFLNRQIVHRMHPAMLHRFNFNIAAETHQDASNYNR